MGQSKFLWILVYADGTTKNFEGTWDEFINWCAGSTTPVAVIQGDFV